MSESDELIKSVGVNIQEKAALIWSVADTLRGPYKPHEYGLVILPMTVIKRFHDCLLTTHDKVLAAAEKYKNFAVKDGFLREASGYPFYNTSKFTFETLKADPENIEENLKDYLNGFSDNVQDILARMNFSDQVERLSDPDVPMLYQVVSDFCSPKADMSPDKIKAVDMGYIFENLIQRFSESYDEDAGAHFTSRDIVYLMTDLLIAADPNVFDGDHITKPVYDQTMGTSQMLGCTEERLRQLDVDARVTCFGQEFNPCSPTASPKPRRLFAARMTRTCSSETRSLMTNLVDSSSTTAYRTHRSGIRGTRRLLRWKRSTSRPAAADFP